MGEERKILFDTAIDTWPFLYNIEKLEIDLEGLDAIVLSHGHSDHTVATVEAIKMAGGCNVYSHPHCFLPRFYKPKTGKLTRGGVPEGQEIINIQNARGKMILTSDPSRLYKGSGPQGRPQG